MRIDKYLWAIRVYKTRSIATEACRMGRVRCNGAVAKASREIKTGDRLDVRQHSITCSYQILALLPTRVAASKVPEFARDITSPEELEKLTALSSTTAFEWRDAGSSRPTKRERREIDEFKQV
jgi:ribosome-associated heat shock protein Hsp15